jgi:uncharacterized protein
MDITPLIPDERQVIQAYGDGRFRISGVAHEGSVLVLPDRTLAWPVAQFAAVTMESLAPLFEAGSAIELLLIGCGPKQVLLPAELRNAIRARDAAVEVMDTGAACRTYNLLLAEERRIAAALIAVA